MENVLTQQVPFWAWSHSPAAELLSEALGFLISFVGEMSGLTLMTFGSFHLTEFLSTVGDLLPYSLGIAQYEGVPEIRGISKTYGTPYILNTH